MAGAACKVLENNGLRALSVSLERILMEPELNGGLIDEDERKEMIQQMADIDRVAYHGGTVEVSYGDIMVRLEEISVLSADVWNVYAKPDRTGSAGEGKGRRKEKDKKGEGGGVSGGGNGKG